MKIRKGESVTGRSTMIITYSMLRDMLDLPEGTRLSCAREATPAETFGNYGVAMALVVEHPSLAEGYGEDYVVPQYEGKWRPQFRDWGKPGAS